MKESIKYIQSYYLTIKQLAEKSNVSESLILEMIEHKCLPDASYKVTESIQITSLFGNPTQFETVFYYNKHNISKIIQVTSLRKTLSYSEIAYKFKTQFYLEYKNLLVEQSGNINGFENLFINTEINEKEAKPFIEKEWNYVLDGTYGLCTTTSSVEEIVTKEVLVKKIDKLTDSCNKEILSDEETELLSQYISQLDKVQAMFAPHERHKTSRYKSIDRVVEKYKLTCV